MMFIIFFVLVLQRTSASDLACHINGSRAYDACNNLCVCHSGELTHCCRERKEFTQMNVPDRRRYTHTVFIASTQKPYKKRYERIVSKHAQFFPKGIHEEKQFLPWHRWYVLQMENLLREVDCRVTVPYWDWPARAATLWRGLHSDVWNIGDHGFGGDGDPLHGDCVTMGPFAMSKWNVTPSGGGGCLQRQFEYEDLEIPDTAAVKNIFMAFPAARDFSKFAREIRIQIHNPLHEKVCGAMCNPSAPNDPIFWLHHTYIDKLWNDWQNSSHAHKFTDFYVKNASNNSPMLATKFRPTDFLDTHSQPGHVNVCYT